MATSVSTKAPVSASVLTPYLARRRLGRASAMTQHKCATSTRCWVCDSLDPTYNPSRPASLSLQPGRAAGLREVAHAQDVALPLGHGDDAAGVEQIEDVGRLDALVVGRQRQLVALVVGTRRRLAGLQRRLALLLSVLEVLQQRARVGVLEVVARVLLLGLQEHVAVGELALIRAAVEVEIEHAVDALHVHGEPLQSIGDLARHWRAVEAADLLEIGELRHLHTVAPHLPAEPPGAQ